MLHVSLGQSDCTKVNNNISVLTIGYVAHAQIILIHMQITFDCIKPLIYRFHINWVAIKLFLKDEYQVDGKAG